METAAVTSTISALPMGGILWSVLALLFIVFGLYSVVLLWHWKEYSTGKYTTVANMTIYLGVGLGLLALMLLATLWYTMV